MSNILYKAIEKLNNDFSNLDFTYHDIPNSNDKIFYWLGEENEDIAICVLKTKYISEGYHKQDYFFFNYAYKNSYQALSQKYNNLITIYEDECYTSQPHCGYAIKANSNEDVIIIGVLIKKETFFRDYLPILSNDNSMFHFFLDPQTNKFSDEFIKLSFKDNLQVRSLLEMMVIEYANKKEDTGAILKPMVLTLLMLIARQHKLEQPEIPNATLSDKILQYINEHSENITLNQIAEHFSYHPNYISSVLHKDTGKTFSQLLLKKRMNKAVILLKNTTLSIEEISNMLGYSDTSNFYKAFKDYYNSSPREYINS